MSLQEFSCRMIDENLSKFCSSLPRPPPPLDCLFYIQSFSFLILIQNSQNNDNDGAGSSFPLEMLLQSERYRYQYFAVKRCHHYATNICYRGVEMVRLDTSRMMIQCRRPNQRPIILCFEEQKRKNVCLTNNNKDGREENDNCYNENFDETQHNSPQIRNTMFAIQRLLEAFGQFELIPIELYRNYFAKTVWDNIQLSFILLKKRFPPLYFINSSFHTGPQTTAAGLQSSQPFDVTLEKIFKQLKADYLGNIRLMKYRMETYRRNRHLNLHRHSSTVDHQDQPNIDLSEDPKIILANYKQKFLRERENFLSRIWSSLFSR